MGFSATIPEGRLGRHVAMIWDCHMAARPFALERILPKAGASLIVNLADDETRGYREDGRWTCIRKSGSVLVGPGTTASIIDTAEQTFVSGIEFHPGGVRHFLREPLDRLRDADTNLADLEREATSHLREKLLESGSAQARLAVLGDWLNQRWQADSVPAVVGHALDCLSRAPQVQRVAELSNYTGVSARRLCSLFTEHVGMSPKRFLRLQRFRAVTALTHRKGAINWSAVAADCGFHDQAHLVHEFREFSGLTPTAWMTHASIHESHVPIPMQQEPERP